LIYHYYYYYYYYHWSWNVERGNAPWGDVKESITTTSYYYNTIQVEVATVAVMVAVTVADTVAVSRSI
jgi:hypothetical protein